jgi:multidrug efflux pump subunit AcrA (membrane-fusion protein)
MNEWAPWKDADPETLGRVFELESFDAQVRALLELAPKASSKELAALPWTESHTLREFRVIADAWRLERQTKREQDRSTNERPLADVVREQLEAATRTGNTKEAIQLLDLEQKIAKSRAAHTENTEDDFTRLSDVEVMLLAALCHKLRDEPITEIEAGLLALVAQLDTNTAET